MSKAFDSVHCSNIQSYQNTCVQ